MAVIRKSITFTEKLNEWVQSVVAQGDYANESEYVRDLIRHDREKRANHFALQDAIKKGVDSGISNQNIMDVWKEAEMKFNKKND